MEGLVSDQTGSRKGRWFLRSGVIEAPKPTLRERATEASAQVKGKAGGAVRACGDAVADLRGRLGACGSGAKASTGAVSMWFNGLLGSRDFSFQLDRWMRDSFASGPASLYDRAMDAVHIREHLGGYHRLFDGGHDLAGAWNACRAAGRDSLAADCSGYLQALLKDLVTPMGLPVATLDKCQFDALATALSAHLGISRAWLADAVSVTGTELLGSVSATLALALNWKDVDCQRFAELVGSLGISALASGNPILAVLVMASLARTYQMATGRDNARSMLSSLATGGFGSAVTIGAMSLVSGPVWVGMMVGICASVLARQACVRAGRAMAETDWRDTAAFVQGYLARTTPALSSGLSC